MWSVSPFTDILYNKLIIMSSYFCTTMNELFVLIRTASTRQFNENPFLASYLILISVQNMNLILTWTTSLSNLNVCSQYFILVSYFCLIMNYGYSSEQPHGGSSNEYTHYLIHVFFCPNSNFGYIWRQLNWVHTAVFDISFLSQALYHWDNELSKTAYMR